MMEDKDLPSPILAAGPSGLESVLNDFLQHAQQDAAFAATEHYILYQFNQQKALIKVDTSQMPFHFWYYDLLGRPATNTVKEVIAQFVWDHCGEKERYQEAAGRK
jgi:hypothetical protein